MEIDHGTLVWFAKSFGLFYLHRAFPHRRRLCLLAVEQEAVRSRRGVHPPR